MTRDPKGQAPEPMTLADPMDDDAVAEALPAAFRRAFDAIGGADALADWANANRTPFYAAIARFLLAGRRGAAAAMADEIEGFVSAEPLSVEEWEEAAREWARARGRA